LGKVIQKTTPWSELNISGDGQLIQSIEKERLKYDSVLSIIDRWNISDLLERTVTAEQPATFDEMMPLWVGDAALSPIPPSRKTEYIDFLSPYATVDAFNEVYDNLAQDRGGDLECDLGPVHDYLLIKKFLTNFDDDDKQFKFLEIGGGYGRLAEIFMTRHCENITYIISDSIPESIYYSYAYLKTRLPDVNVTLVLDGTEIPDLNQSGIIILPSWRLGGLNSNAIDLFMNVASIQETIDKTAHAYFSEAERLLKKEGMFFFENSREFFYRREYHYPDNWQYQLKTRSPRSRTIDYPVDILHVKDSKQEKNNIAILAAYYQVISNLAIDEVAELKAQIKEDRQTYIERKNLLIERNQNLKEKNNSMKSQLNEQTNELKNLKENSNSIRFIAIKSIKRLKKIIKR